MIRFTTIAVASALATLSATALQATITTYTSASAFAAAVAIEHQADLAAISLGRFYAPFTDDGITFTTLGQDFYGVPAGGALTNNPNAFPTVSLSADGDENFRFQLASGASFHAIGLDYATNAYGPPTLSLYAPGGSLIGSVPVAIAPNTIGFFGVISTTAVGSVTSIVDRGYIADTAIDNVRIGSPAAVPEPATWGLIIVGFGAIGFSTRRSRGVSARFS